MHVNTGNGNGRHIQNKQGCTNIIHNSIQICTLKGVRGSINGAKGIVAEERLAMGLINVLTNMWLLAV